MTLPSAATNINIAKVIGKHKIVLLTGRAGTGKTTLLKQIKHLYDNVVTVAPTAIAALNCEGATIHSFFQLEPRPYVPNDEALSPSKLERNFSKDKKQIIRNLSLLIIDEISMVKGYTLDAIDTILQYFRKSDAPFGGASLLMIGDPLQLPPVINNNTGEREIIEHFYESEYFFDANVIRQNRLLYYELTKVHRQTDKRFVEILDRIRYGKHAQEDLDILNERFTDTPPKGCLTLTTTKKKAQAINDIELKSIDTKSHIFYATINGIFPKNLYPTQSKLELKIGAQVMFIKNSNDYNYRNGMLGIVKEIGKSYIVVQTKNGEVTVENEIWENQKFRYKNKKVETVTVGTFEQLPIILAWTITIHRSQGLTFDKVCVDCKGAFAKGQVYVALSRCRSLDGLYLTSKLSWEDIRVSDRAIRFLQKYTGQYRDTHTTNDKSKYKKSPKKTPILKRMICFLRR